MLEAVTLGETMVCFEAEQWGPLRHVHFFSKWAGGAETNFAIALARLGHSIGWISQLGDDELGRYIDTEIKGEGVDVSQVKFCQKMPTGIFLMEKETPSKFKCYYYRKGSAASSISVDSLNDAYIAQAKLLYLTGITPILSSSCEKAAKMAVQIAKSAKAKILFDPNIRLKLLKADKIRKKLLFFIKNADFFLPSEEELKLLMDEDNLHLAVKKVLSYEAKTVIVKLGGKGAILVDSSGKQISHPGYHQDFVVNTIGAGDAFDAGFACGVLRGMNFSDSLKVANALGAFATLGKGSYQTLPTFNKVLNFIQDKEEITR